MKPNKKEEGTVRQSVKALFALLLVLAISLTGCGSSESDTLGVGKPVTSKGAIEKFGSITVNGVKFETTGAKLFLPDDAAKPERILQSETEIVDDKLLKIGMVVTVKGVVDDNGVSGKATEIEFRDNLKARIDDKGVDINGNDFIVVMGQKIILDDKIKPLIATLNKDDVVQISGLPDDKGGLRATFIEKKEAAEIEHLPEFEMKGFVISVAGDTAVISHDPAMTTGVSVTFLPGKVPALHDFIEVKVPKATTFTLGGGFSVTEAPHVEMEKIEMEHSATMGDHVMQVSIEGFPSNINLTTNTLDLNGRQVKFDQSQIFVGTNAGTKTDLSITKKIQAEGAIDANGVLNATKITVKVTALPNPTISSGEIERLGSVVVNGVKFRTTGAVLHLPDDKTARVLQTETEIHGLLKPGMIITVKGGLDDVNATTGVASEIRFSDALEGKIESVDDVNKTITVMGQTVRIEDNVTRLNDDNAKLFSTAGFAKDDIVEVSGFADDNGGLRATRVAKKTEGELEVKGFVVSKGIGSFGLSLKADGTLPLTVNFTGTLPEMGQFVEIKANAAPSNGVVTATEVKLEDGLGKEAEKVEVEGIVTSVTADGFMINGRKVVTTTANFEGGLKSDIVAGAKIEAEGPLDAGGAINAVKVMFRGNIKIEADVTAFTAGSSLTVLGKQVAINSFTRVVGNLTGVGNHVEVRAYLDRNGKPVASRIVLKASDKTRAFLQGPVTLTTGGGMSILGTTIVTTSSQFRISHDTADAQGVSRDVFFGKLKDNVTVVKVRWATSDTTQPVDEAEIQFGK